MAEECRPTGDQGERRFPPSVISSASANPAWILRFHIKDDVGSYLYRRLQTQTSASGSAGAAQLLWTTRNLMSRAPSEVHPELPEYSVTGEESKHLTYDFLRKKLNLFSLNEVETTFDSSSSSSSSSFTSANLRGNCSNDSSAVRAFMLSCSVRTLLLHHRLRLPSSCQIKVFCSVFVATFCCRSLGPRRHRGFGLPRFSSSSFSSSSSEPSPAFVSPAAQQNFMRTYEDILVVMSFIFIIR